MSSAGKASAWIAVALGIIAIWGVFIRGIVWAGDSRYATHETVESKITLAVNTLSGQIGRTEQSRIEDAIRELEIRIAVGEATKADRAQLEYYKRQREESLKK